MHYFIHISRNHNFYIASLLQFKNEEKNQSSFLVLYLFLREKKKNSNQKQCYNCRARFYAVKEKSNYFQRTFPRSYQETNTSTGIILSRLEIQSDVAERSFKQEPWKKTRSSKNSSHDIARLEICTCTLQDTPERTVEPKRTRGRRTSTHVWSGSARDQTRAEESWGWDNIVRSSEHFYLQFKATDLSVYNAWGWMQRDNNSFFSFFLFF